jgi:hypothetical protein
MQQRDEGSSSHYRVALNTADKVFLAEGRLAVGHGDDRRVHGPSVIEESPRRRACGRRNTPRRSAASPMSASRRYPRDLMAEDLRRPLGTPSRSLERLGRFSCSSPATTVPGSGPADLAACLAHPPLCPGRADSHLHLRNSGVDASTCRQSDLRRCAITSAIRPCVTLRTRCDQNRRSRLASAERPRRPRRGRPHRRTRVEDVRAPCAR